MFDMLDKFYFYHPKTFLCILVLCFVALFAAAGYLEAHDDGYITCTHCSQQVYKCDSHEYNGQLVCDTCYEELVR